MDLFPVSLAASRVLFFGELHSAERVGHHRKYNEGENGQAAEHGCQEIELHVIQEEVHEACDEESATAYPYYERDGFSLELDFLVAMVALDGTVFPFRK